MTKKQLSMHAVFLLLIAISPTLCAQTPPAAPPPPPAPPALAALPAHAPQDGAPALAPAAPVGPPAPFAFNAPPFEGENFLGVSIEEVTPENMERYGLTGAPRGVAVTHVVKGSPAERAGLREKDVILRYDGEAVSSYRKLSRLIGESAPGHHARLSVRRGGSEEELNVTLGQRQSFTQIEEKTKSLRAEELRRRADEARARVEEAQRRADDARRRLEELRRHNSGVFSLSFGASRRIGVSTTPLGKQLADFFGVEQGGGVLIASVEPKSPAERAGLKAGDVITQVDGAPVDEAGDLSRAINRRDEGEITLTIVRDKKQRTVRVTPERSQSPALFGPGALWASPVAVASTRSNIATPRLRITIPRTIMAPHLDAVPGVRPPMRRVRRPILWRPVL